MNFNLFLNMFSHFSDEDYTAGLVKMFLPIAIGIIVIIGGIFVAVKVLRNRDEKEENGEHNNNKDKVIDDMEISKYITEFNKTEFLDSMFQLFITAEECYSEFEFENLKQYVTDDVYEMYAKEMNSLKEKRQKHVLDDYAKRDIELIDFKLIDKVLYAEIKLVLSELDYYTTDGGDLVKGDKEHKVNHFYILSFKRVEDNKWILCKKENE